MVYYNCTLIGVSVAGQSYHQDTKGALSELRPDDRGDWLLQRHGVCRFRYAESGIEWRDKGGGQADG